MECYISREERSEWNPETQNWDKRVTIYKGFPIVSESQRSTAESWARTMKSIQIPEELVNCGVDGFEDRMNNKIFKVYYMADFAGSKIKLYFDMYVPAMLDLMRNGVIDHETIKSTLVFIDRSRLVVKGGELYNEYLKREAKKKALKETKVISTKNLKFGGCYSAKPDGDKRIYVGPVKGKGHLIIDLGWNSNELSDPTRWGSAIKITKSPGFKFEHDKNSVDLDTLKKYVIKKREVYEKEQSNARKINEERMESAKRRAGDSSWISDSWKYYYSPYTVPEYKEEFEILDILNKIIADKG